MQSSQARIIKTEGMFGDDLVEGTKVAKNGCDSMLRDHLQIKNETSPYDCSTCGLTFVTQLRLRNHKRTHSDRFACGMCNKFYSSRINLNIHLSSRVHAKHKPFHCGHCQKRFSVKIYLQRHKLRHLKSGSLVKCQDCWRKFSRVSDLVLHQKKHQIKYECSKCLRTFRTQFLCSNHRCETKYQCACRKTFGTIGSLKKHKESHLMEKNQGCPTCGKTFAYRCYMKFHMELHNKFKVESLVCDVCFKKFPRRSHLVNHKKTHKEVVCEICGEVFNQRMEFLVHQKTHKRLYPCDVCGKSFRRPSCLKRHKFTHDRLQGVQCSQCDTQVRTDQLLSRHMSQAHEEKPLRKPTCAICSKTFLNGRDLDLHSKVHNKKPSLFADSPGLLGYLNYSLSA